MYKMRASVIDKLNLICRKCFRKTEGGWTLTFRKTTLNCTLRLSSLFSSILVFFFFFVMLKFLLVFIYHSKQMLILKKRRFPLELKRPQITWRSFFITQSVENQLAMNKARRQTPTSLPGRGWPESDRCATHALRTISVLSAIVRKISNALS